MILSGLCGIRELDDVIFDGDGFFAEARAACRIIYGGDGIAVGDREASQAHAFVQERHAEGCVVLCGPVFFACLFHDTLHIVNNNVCKTLPHVNSKVQKSATFFERLKTLRKAERGWTQEGLAADRATRWSMWLPPAPDETDARNDRASGDTMHWAIHLFSHVLVEARLRDRAVAHGGADVVVDRGVQ